MNKERSPWAWIPSLYFAEGIPYILVMTLSVVFYKRMGISNTDIALYTSWLYLPWVIKPLWSPVVDILKTKRWWIATMQLILGVGLAGVAFTIPVPSFFQYTLAFFWLVAFSSATHDIAADGFYLLSLNSEKQAYFVGIRSTFYRFAMLTGQGLLVILAGTLETATGLEPMRVEVSSSIHVAQPRTVSLPASTLNDTEKSLHFLTKANVHLPTATIEAAEADSLIEMVRSWNVEHHFYERENKRITAKTDGQSWWATYISAPLSNVLRSKFGQEPVSETNERGNMAVLEIRLSGKPAETVVLNFGYEKGSKNIQLVQNYRFQFTPKNWEQPAYALVQLDPKLKTVEQAVFVGRSGNITFAWSIVFFVVAIAFVLFSIYHKFILPRPVSDATNNSNKQGFLSEFFHTFVTFFQKKEIGVALLFLLFYRLAESQIVKMASPFLLDAPEVGGLGVTTGDLGFVYGTVGMLSLTVGGVLGGIVASRKGLKYWVWWMALAMNLPNVGYLLLAIYLPQSLWYIGGAVALEQFGYGFGFTAYMLYMIHISEGKHKTAHFAITTGFMALGMMIPGMVSGWLQEIIGYQNFFVWVLFCTIPGFLVLPFLKFDSKKQK